MLGDNRGEKGEPQLSVIGFLEGFAMVCLASRCTINVFTIQLLPGNLLLHYCFCWCRFMLTRTWFYFNEPTLWKDKNKSNLKKIATMFAYLKNALEPWKLISKPQFLILWLMPPSPTPHYWFVTIGGGGLPDQWYKLGEVWPRTSVAICLIRDIGLGTFSCLYYFCLQAMCFKEKTG